MLISIQNSFVHYMSVVYVVSPKVSFEHKQKATKQRASSSKVNEQFWSIKILTIDRFIDSSAEN